MASLAPQIGTGIAFEQPIQQPSALGGIAALAGLFVPQGAPKEAKQPSSSDILVADKAQFYSELQAGRASMEQGNAAQVAQGRHRITNAYRTFAKRYGREHDDINTAFSDATGISYNVEVTGTSINMEQIASTPEFAVAASIYQKQNPNATADQVHQATMQKEIERLGTDARIKEIETQKKVNWINAEGDYITKARQVGDRILGLISTGYRDTIMTPDEAAEIRREYHAYYGGITKPAGVDQESWDNYKKNYITPLTDAVETSVGLAQQKGISDDMAIALEQIVAKAINQGKLPTGVRLKMKGDSAQGFEAFQKVLKVVAKDPKYLVNYNFVTTSSFEEVLDWVTEFKFRTDSDQLKIKPDPYLAASDEEKRNSLVEDSESLTLNTDAGVVAVDLLALNARLDHTPNKALQPEDFATVFSGKYFEGIEKVYKENPVIGRQIAQDAIRVLDGQEVSIARAIKSEASQAGFNIVSGKLVPNEELSDSNEQWYVDKFFGGDWDLAVRSDGTDANGMTHDVLRGKISTARYRIQPKLDKFIRTSKSIAQLKEKFLPPAVTGIPDEVSKEIAGEAMRVLEATKGKNEKFPTPSGLRGLTQLVDRTEGAGNYDTLFGHSQKSGKRHAGIRVSEMTIGELKRFAKDRGEGSYGNWVKGQSKAGLFATPMGRYQFVGDTLESTAKAMGLDDSIIFDQRTQDAMFAYKVRERLKGATTPEEKRSQLRAEWAGFRHVNDADLDAAIEAFESGKSIDFGGITVATGSTAPETSPRPTHRQEVAPDSPNPLPSATEGTSQGAAGASVQPTEGFGSTPEGGTTKGKEELSPREADQLWMGLSVQTQTLLLKIFGDVEAVKEAIATRRISGKDVL